MNIKNLSLVLGSIFTLAASPLAQAKKLTVMSYNVENLFDTVHDEGKEDFTYLPKSVKRQNPEIYAFCKAQKSYFYREECFNIDWTSDKLNKKLDSLTRVLKTVARGSGPDILAIQEVENINVLNIWMKRNLKDMGYREVVLVEGPDNRGIDGAIISKLPIVGAPIYHDFFLKLNWEEAATTLFSTDAESVFAAGGKGKPKRGILEAIFSMGDGKEVSVLTNHWPSQANPSTERYEIAKILHGIAVKADADQRALISMGDYNTIESDQPHGLNEWALNPRRKVRFFDARAEYLIEAGGNAKNLPGSHWYKGQYGALDKILVLESTAAQVQPDWLSFKVVAEDFMMTDAENGAYKLKPKRFDFATAEGFADHLPITIDLKL